VVDEAVQIEDAVDGVENGVAGLLPAWTSIERLFVALLLYLLCS
jgi:hypothetical protein